MLSSYQFFFLDETSYSMFGYNYDQFDSDGINDVSCPDNATSLSQCSFTLSNSSDTNCRSHSSDLRVTCSNSKHNVLTKPVYKSDYSINQQMCGFFLCALSRENHNCKKNYVFFQKFICIQIAQFKCSNNFMIL